MNLKAKATTDVSKQERQQTNYDTDQQDGAKTGSAF